MKKLPILGFVLVLLASLWAAGQCTGKASAAQSASSATQHVTVTPAELKWTPLFLGLETAVVSGDPSKPGAPFVMRVRATKEAAVPAHWHPEDENVTVLTGAIKIGMGEKYDAKAMHAVSAGSYTFVPKTMPHSAWHAAGSVIQIHGIGPFTLTFVNPADDPRKASAR